MELKIFFEKLWRGGRWFTTYHKSTTTNRNMADVAHWHTSIESALRLHPPPNSNDWWFCVNPSREIPSTNSKGEKKSSKWIGAQNDYIQLANCLYGDFDAKDFGSKKAILVHIEEQLETEPSFIVDSGNGYHCYWLIDEPIHDMEFYARMLRGWIAYVGADMGAKSISRKLRIPGTLNHKKQPLPVHFVKFEPEISYDICEFEPYTLPKYTPPDLSDLDTIEAEDVNHALLHLGSHRCDHYGSWFQIVAAIKNGLGEAGRDIAENWSSGGNGNEHEQFDKAWDAIQESRDGDCITVATLFGAFRTDSPIEFEEWRADKSPFFSADDDAIFKAYPKQAKTCGFSASQMLEFDATGKIVEFEVGEDIAPLIEHQIMNGEGLNNTRVNNIMLCDFTLPNAQSFRAFGIDEQSINAQDIAWTLSNTFEGGCLLASMNGEKRAVPYFFDKQYGWTNNPNVFRSLARHSYTTVRQVTDLAYGHYRPPNLSNYLTEIKKSLAGYLDNLRDKLEASPKHIARDKTSYINMANGERLEPNRDYLTTRFLDKYPDLTWLPNQPNSGECNNIIRLISEIFLPKELKDELPSDRATKYFKTLMCVIGQTYCNETNPRQFHYLYGKPDSGKGIFARLNKLAFPELVEMVSPAIVGKNNSEKLLEIGKLDGALATFIPDMKDVPLSENINSLVGDGYIQGKKMYVGLIDVPIRFTIWMMSNYPPNLAEDSVASRAWVWYTDNEFDNDFDGSDEALRALIPEYIVFVQRCVSTYLEYGLKEKPKYMAERIAELRSESSVLQKFINKHCVINPDYAVPQRWLWQKFGEKMWSDIDEKKPIKLSEFKKAILAQKGVYAKKTSIKNEVLSKSGYEGSGNESITNGRFYMGIGWKL